MIHYCPASFWDQEHNQNEAEKKEAEDVGSSVASSITTISVFSGKAYVMCMADCMGCEWQLAWA